MRDSGMDIGLNEKASKIAFNYAQKSFLNVKDAKFMTAEGDFSGGFAYMGTDISIASDGIGTKIEIAERMKKYDTLGYDLLAMVSDDLISNFYKPVFVSNILDVDYIDLKIVEELMKGLYNASKESGVIVSGGEIAELGERVNGYGKDMHFNWAATAVGFKIDVDCDIAEEGDYIYALASNGFRSNGFSLARRILQNNFGDFWHEKTINGHYWGEILLKPSKIFFPFIMEILKKNKIKSVAHITGGGLNNISRVLPDNLDFYLDININSIPFYFKKLMELGNITLEKALGIWNLGFGMALIVKDEMEFKDWPLVKIGRVVKKSIL